MIQPANDGKLTEMHKAYAREGGKEPCLLSVGGIHDYRPTAGTNPGNSWTLPCAEFAAVCGNCGEWSKPR